MKSPAKPSKSQVPNEKALTDFQKFLLTGPVMDDEQYKAYKEARKHFNRWRSK